MLHPSCSQSVRALFGHGELQASRRLVLIRLFEVVVFAANLVHKRHDLVLLVVDLVVARGVFPGPELLALAVAVPDGAGGAERGE
jgi:hypothetical protein